MLGIYARQSVEKTTNNSIEDQIEKGKLYAATLEMDYKIYIDKGESAIYSHTDNRPSVNDLIQDIKNGIIKEIFVYDLSRLVRNDIVNNEFLEVFKKYNVNIYSVIDGITDVKNPQSVFMNKLKAIINAQYVQEQSIKIKSVLELRAKSGKAPGGWLKALGYKANDEKLLVIDEEESPLVKEIFELCLKGVGSGKIAEMLNERNEPTKSTRVLLKTYGDYKNIPTKYQIKSWQPNTVLRILKNSLYKGERVHVDKIFDAPKIIEPEIWELAQIQINNNRNNHNPSTHNYLLNKLCYCGICGSNISGKTRLNKRDHFYKCASKVKKKPCGLRSINIDTLDSIIWLMIVKDDLIFKQAKQEVENSKKPDFLDGLQKERKIIEKKLTQSLKEKENAFNFLNKGIFEPDEAEQKMRDANVKILNYKKILNDIDVKIDFNFELSNQINDVEELVRNWENLVFTNDFNLQYDLIRLFVNKIVVDFDNKNDLYTINTHVKIPNHNEILTFYIDSKGNPKKSSGNSNSGGNQEVKAVEKPISKQKNSDLTKLPPYLTMQHLK